MIYIENTTVRTAKSEIYLGNMGLHQHQITPHRCQQSVPRPFDEQIDPAAGNNFITMGTTQFQYVAYAMFANSVLAENISGIVPVARGGTGASSLSTLKSNLSLDFISAFKKIHLSGSSKEMIKTRICRKQIKTFGDLKGEFLSKLVRILDCDFTQLDAKELSMIEMIDTIENIAYSEFFGENRILSLHCLKCVRIFYSIYIRLKIDIFGGFQGVSDYMVDNSSLKNLINPFAYGLNMHLLKYLDQPKN